MSDATSPFDAASHDVPRQGGDDLSWRAFLYVADEMSDDETEAFEAELTENVAACEAVARVVRLNQAVAFVEHGENGRPSEVAAAPHPAAGHPATHLSAAAGPATRNPGSVARKASDEDLVRPGSLARRASLMQSALAVAAVLALVFGGGVWFAVRWVRVQIAHAPHQQEPGSQETRPGDFGESSEAADLVALWRNPRHPALSSAGASPAVDGPTRHLLAGSSENESTENESTEEDADDSEGADAWRDHEPGRNDRVASGEVAADGGGDDLNPSIRRAAVVAETGLVPDWLLVALQDVAETEPAGSSPGTNPDGAPEVKPSRPESY